MSPNKNIKKKNTHDKCYFYNNINDYEILIIIGYDCHDCSLFSILDDMNNINDDETSGFSYGNTTIHQ